VRDVSRSTAGLAQAASETSSSIEEMAGSMREVDTNAAETGRLSASMVALADGGQERVRLTMVGMETIQEATETAERVIRGLAGRVQEIGAIVDVIENVADETNLLALNAAIIASQSGEQGRAFSVVADEIKDLADRVMGSTREIGALIRAVQEESGNATGAIERGSESVARGVDLSAEAGGSLEEITVAARSSGERIAEIVSAVREQARAAAHVVALTERVRDGVDAIRQAGSAQERGNEVVLSGTGIMRDVAQQVHRSTEEQARGASRIREAIETVHEAVERIGRALADQSAACQKAAAFMEQVHARTRDHEEATRRMGGATHALRAQAVALREDVARFKF
jgi:methyl-accepting chemotaxis protein